MQVRYVCVAGSGRGAGIAACGFIRTGLKITLFERFFEVLKPAVADGYRFSEIAIRQFSGWWATTSMLMTTGSKAGGIRLGLKAA